MIRRRRIGHRAADLATDRRGAVLVIAALAMPVLLGVTAMVIDLSNARMVSRQLQLSADAAALAAVGEVADPPTARARAVQYGTRNMPVADHGNIINPSDVMVGHWDKDARTFSPGATPANAVRVTARRSSANGNPLPLLFANVMGLQETDISVSAVALAGASGQPGCLLALDGSETSGAMRFNSMDQAELHDCVPIANSTHSRAITINSLDRFHAGSLYTAGGYRAGSIDRFDLDQPAQTDQAPVDDPFASLADPAPGGCDWNDRVTSGTISPGVYCGGLRMSGSGTLNPGTYYIVNGDLEFSSMGSLRCNCSGTGSGVSLVLTGSSPAQVGTFSFSSIDSVNLRAPADSSYDFPGILLYVDRDSSYQTSSFSSIDSLTMNGLVYAPSQRISFSSIDYSAQTDCAAIAGFRLEFNSIDSFGRADNCPAYGSSGITIGGATALLVE